MITQTQRLFACAAALGVLASLAGCKSYERPVGVPRPLPSARVAYAAGAVQPFILAQPVSQLVKKGKPVTFSAAVGGSYLAANLTYEWQINKAPVVIGPTNFFTPADWAVPREYDAAGFAGIPGATSPVLSIPHVSSSDVAFYRVKVSAGGTNVVFSRPAKLWVWEQVHSILVHGTVVTESGNGGACPGIYAKRVDYDLGYLPASGTRKAKDQTNYGTWIEWVDYLGANGCGITPSSTREITVNVVNPGWYHYFTIYIPSGKLLPNPYDIYLTNFD
jgi:hypothetical protein